VPADLRTHLAKVSEAARAAQAPAGAVAPLRPPTPTVRPPSLILRPPSSWCVAQAVPPHRAYLAAGFPDFDGFDGWLRADPVHRDNELFLIDKLERGNMHDVVRGVGQQLQLTVWPEDFNISPDPIPGGGTTGGGQVAVGDVLIVATLPGPVGTDRGHERITLCNATPAAIDLVGRGWWMPPAAAPALAARSLAAGWCRSPPLERSSLETEATPSSWSIPAAPPSTRWPTRPIGSDPAARSALAAEVTVDGWWADTAALVG
jgi:hypothetical protein